MSTDLQNEVIANDINKVFHGYGRIPSQVREYLWISVFPGDLFFPQIPQVKLIESYDF